MDSSHKARAKLQASQSGATFLSGLFHICASCKRIKNDRDQWQQFEQYISERSETSFSHGICPECSKGIYGLDLSGAAEEQAVDIAIKDEDLDDAVIVNTMHIVSNKAYEHARLYPDFRRLFARYIRLSRRMKRIARISDSFQGELRDIAQRLQTASRTDPLTGANNRGYFIELLSAELERSQRYDRSFSVLMLDLDHFKSINDTYGHQAGDEALKALVAVLGQSGLRQSDFWGRIGGEEFAIVLTETVLERAELPAERIRALLAATPITHGANTFSMTASIGICQYHRGDTLESLLHRADQAMYAAKQSGRNRICVSP